MQAQEWALIAGTSGISSSSDIKTLLFSVTFLHYDNYVVIYIMFISCGNPYNLKMEEWINLNSLINFKFLN